MRTRRLALVTLIGLIAAGCSSRHVTVHITSTTTASTTTASTATASTTQATTTTTTVGPTTTTAYAPATPQASPVAAGALLIAAWSSGNRAAAAAIAAPAAVAALFAIPYPPGAIQPRGCTDPTVNPGTCTYRNTQTEGIYEVTVAETTGGWYVTAVTPET